MTLNHCIKIYVPGTDNVNQADPELSRRFTNETLARLASFFGGATAQTAQGAWTDTNGNLVLEPINICYAYCSADDLLAKRSDCEAWAREVCSAMHQEAVSVEVDNELQFIS